MLFFLLLLVLENDLGEFETSLAFIVNFYHKVTIKGAAY